ncbi:hypothetical protein VP01_185g6 [Puccinia sorghi]|uniref:Uncharacterized protein n=1 Tax=Puccinia sorghi TaxID=27349 RepID=A0A0L6VDJ8_9BASI|nr:hypothetical protein VP01_185g6 [Puccinia sorghi]
MYRACVQVWTGRSVNLNVLRPFGCLTYSLIPKEKQVFKLHPTAEKGIMLGYDNDFSSSNLQIRKQESGLCQEFQV